MGCYNLFYSHGQASFHQYLFLVTFTYTIRLKTIHFRFSILYIMMKKKLALFCGLQRLKNLLIRVALAWETFLWYAKKRILE